MNDNELQYEENLIDIFKERFHDLKIYYQLNDCDLDVLYEYIEDFFNKSEIYTDLECSLLALSLAYDDYIIDNLNKKDNLILTKEMIDYSVKFSEKMLIDASNGILPKYS